MNERIDTEEFYSQNFFKSATFGDVKRCLAAGCDPNARNERGFTPLHRAAATTGDPEVIIAMLKAGGNAHSLTNGDVTPLHSAAGTSDEPRVLEILLGAGAKPNAKNFNNGTPLNMAADRRPGNLSLIEVLLGAGAKPNVRDRDNYAPLHRAASRCEDPAIIEALIRAGADPNLRGVENSTPLHMAVSANSAVWEMDGKADVVEALIRAGADPNLADNYGFTAMHFAASRARLFKVFELLIEAGGDLTAMDCDGKTPLQIMNFKKEKPQIVEYLKRVEAQQKSGPRPLIRNRQTTASISRGGIGSSLSRLRTMLGGSSPSNKGDAPKKYK